ncbi:hypothetical protein OH77DRAFT_1431803 [Trametes cingulata]|nr:hypothetical protein OH77DRAFT_1431803 [Trametes cingulata]
MSAITEYSIAQFLRPNWLCSSLNIDGVQTASTSRADPGRRNTMCAQDMLPHRGGWILRSAPTALPADSRRPSSSAQASSQANPHAMDIDGDERTQSGAGTSVTLESISRDLAGLQAIVVERQQHVDDQLRSLWGTLQVVAQRKSRGHGGAQNKKGGKDSAANYLRQCVRDHVKKTFYPASSQRPSQLPTAERQMAMLEMVAAGGVLRKPFVYDWSSPSTTAYNRCVEDAFCADFWECAHAGKYDIGQIPSHYQTKDAFVDVLHVHLSHKRRRWTESQLSNGSDARQRDVANHQARNSRMRTTFLNRRNVTQPPSFQTANWRRVPMHWWTPLAPKASALTKRYLLSVAG